VNVFLSVWSSSPPHLGQVSLRVDLVMRGITSELTRRREFIQASRDESKLRDTLPPLRSNDLFAAYLGTEVFREFHEPGAICSRRLSPIRPSDRS
jgi:hypothetical protein